MPTHNQLSRKGRSGKRKKSRARHLNGQPQRSAVVIEVGIRNPRKPNSGERKVARVRFSDGATVLASIPGEGHMIQVHSKVLVAGGSRPDLPGVNYQIVRGVKDDKPETERRQKRSRYGVARPE